MRRALSDHDTENVIALVQNSEQLDAGAVRELMHTMGRFQ
jgi:hypothetical protein